MKKIIIILSLVIINLTFSQKCNEGKNFCLNCDIQTDLCIKCQNEAFIPDEQGGCKGIKKCTLGENYCSECNKEENLCQSCETGFFPDNNGACSFINNCEISYKGLCFKCIEDFILIGPHEEFKFCKSIFSSDLKNCKTINEQNGICSICEDGYYLGQGDSKCTKTDNCYQSNFGTCNKCIDGYYLDRKNDACLLKENQFQNCKESIDGENCEVCDNDYFLSDDYFCIKTNFCLLTKDYECIDCINNYYLAENGNCSFTENCINAEGKTGSCIECSKDYYLDLKDEKCKSNEFDEEFKYCSKFNEICIECIEDYFLGEDNKCCTSKNCAESENGICIFCSKDYFLGKDNKCINTQHCISSNDNYECTECQEDYLLVNKTCIINDDELLKDCKKADDKGKICIECKNDFYLNKTDNFCYSNQDFGQFYKCKTSSDSSDTIDICIECVSGFYLGYDDRKCTHTIGCVTSNKENECHRCDDDFFCLNLLNNTCEKNEYITNEDEMMYYKCILTNENGTKCEYCKGSFEVGENGHCFNMVECDKKSNGECIKCREKNFYGYDLCLNQHFGCVTTSVKNCLRCDNPFERGTCDECYEGYKLNEKNLCEPIE